MSTEQAKAVSASSPAEDLIALLDVVDRLPGAEELRLDSYALLGVGPGIRVVDVGCGAGRAVAEMTGRGAHATGVDVDPQMVEIAGKRWPEVGFRVAGAYELPFDDGALDGYRAEKMYHELEDPARALDEARRVLRPGGRAVLIGQDWDTFVIDSDDAELTRTIVHARADRTKGPRTARRYRNLLLDAGFRDVSVEVRTAVFTGEVMLPMLAGFAEGACAAGAVSREAAGSWVAEQEVRAGADRLFIALPLFVASATRA
ncbi:methyltransferase domain-containing protein [Streptomyces nigrescens]